MKSRRFMRQLAPGVVLLMFASCGADSCSCDGFVAGEFPAEKVDRTIVTSGEVRVTSSGLTFLSDNLPTILESFVPGGLNFCVPPSSFSGVDVCNEGTCATGESGCDMTMSIDDAEIAPVPPNQLDVSIIVGDLNETLTLRTLGSDCTIKLHSAQNENLPATFGATIPVTFAVDSSSPFNDVRVELGEMELDTSDIDFDIDGVDPLDFFVCEGIDGLAAINFVRDLLYGQLESMFGPVLLEQVDSALCVSCDEGCPAGTTCDGDDICRYTDETCPQNPLGLSGRLQLGAALGEYVEDPSSEIDLTVRVADHVSTDTGLTLGLRSGYDPVAQSLCVPVDPTVRDLSPTPLSPTVTGDVRPGGQPFHFGLGYHERALESMLWSVWASGGTCFRVGSETVDLLTTSALGALLPSIRPLTYHQTSEAFIKIVPQTPPDVILGSNAITPEGNGYRIDDPLITVDWKDFDVNIYGFVQDRYTRLLTVRMDLLLPIGLAADGMGGIIPVLGDIEAALTNQRVLHNELLEEDPQRILDLLPTLIGVALPSLAGSLSDPIELPEFFGFRVNIGPGDITSVDNDTSIAIFADLAIVTNPVVAHVDTAVVGHRVDLSRTTPSGLVRPEVHLDVMPLFGLGVVEEPRVEYSWRVDGGTWSLPVRSNELVVDHPTLVLPGAHVVEVRAQYVGEAYTVDPTPARVEIVIDWEAPQVELSRHGSTLKVEAFDAVDRLDQMDVRWRIATGVPGEARWSAWDRQTTLDLAPRDLPERLRVDVQVRDRAGNVGEDTQQVSWTGAHHQPTERAPLVVNPRPERRLGCSASGSGTPSDAALLLVLLVGGVFVGRRRRRASGLGAMFALVIAVGGCKCKDDTGGTPSDGCDPACVPGEMCIDDVCVPSIECSTDDDCGDGEECRGGECAPAPTCEEQCACKEGDIPSCASGSCECVTPCGDGCGDGEFCCFSENECQSLPDPCADQVCDPGYGPVVQSDPTGNSETCSVETGECACERLPPLPLGIHGHYAAIARNAGVTAVAAYNSTYGDLMVGIVGAENEVSWSFVDGVPTEGDIEGDLDGPRGGIADDGDDVGRYTAIAIDDEGELYVFYRDEERGVLKLARGTESNGAYTFTLSDVDTEGDTGYWTSAVHLDGRIHAVWQRRSVAAATSGFESHLRHLAFDAGGSVADPTATMELVSAAPSAHPCGADCEVRGEECFAADAVCREPTSDCGGDCADGTDCWQGACIATYSEPAGSYLRGIATNNELSVTPDGGLLLVSWDGLRNTIVTRRWNDGAWAEGVDVGTGSGPWGSGVVDANGDLHLAWTDWTVTPPTLMYQNVTAAQAPEVVVDGIRDTASEWIVSDVGEDVNLRAGSDGALTLVFHDPTRHALTMATRAAGGGSWQVSDVVAKGDPYTGSPGFYASMLKLPDAHFVVQFNLNNQADPPEGAPAFHE